MRLIGRSPGQRLWPDATNDTPAKPAAIRLRRLMLGIDPILPDYGQPNQPSATRLPDSGPLRCIVGPLIGIPKR